jgi:hypothetical protein
MAKPRKGSPPAPKKKEESCLEKVSVVAGDTMAELIYNESLSPLLQFAVCKDGKVTVEQSLVLGDAKIIPPKAARNAIETGLVTLPSAAADYESQDKLIRDLKEFIHRYADLPPFWEDLIAHYILMTWVYDCFTALPYLRLLGEGGTGKSRLLLICSKLTYKGITAGGSTTASPLFRLVEVYSGTMVMDEADYRHTDLWSDLIKVLNQGYMRGFPVVRSEKVGDSYEPRGYDVFGPKIIANRSRFTDTALESRCLTLESQERRIRKDIPRQVPPQFEEEARQLRDKLLRWRFDNRQSIVPDESKLLDLEPRLAQIGTPVYSVSTDEKFKAQFLEYLRSYGSEQKQLKPQALVIEALLHFVSKGENTLSVSDVTKWCNLTRAEREGVDDWKPKRVGALLRSMGFRPERKNNGYQVYVEPKRLEQLVEEYGLKERKENPEGEEQEGARKQAGESGTPLPPPPSGSSASAWHDFPLRDSANP